MAPHSIGSGTISFGLVSIPVKLYTAASSGGVSFNLLHAKCGSRIKQQTFCPVCNEVIERGALVKGYEFQKEQYVRFTDEELKSLEGEASKVIDIAEFVPLPTVDPIYFEKTYYLGPDKGGEKPYRLLADASRKVRRATVDAMVDAGRAGLRPLLERALGDADAWTRWKALRGLVEIGVEPSRAVVEALSQDPDFRVRLETARALHGPVIDSDP